RISGAARLAHGGRGSRQGDPGSRRIDAPRPAAAVHADAAVLPAGTSKHSVHLSQMYPRRSTQNSLNSLSTLRRRSTTEDAEGMGARAARRGARLAESA